MSYVPTSDADAFDYLLAAATQLEEAKQNLREAEAVYRIALLGAGDYAKNRGGSDA